MAKVTRVLTYEYTDEERRDRDMAHWKIPANGTYVCGPGGPTITSQVIEHGHEHIVEVGDGMEWGLQHPLSCRPNLIECPVNIAMFDAEPPDEGLFAVALLNGEDGSDGLIFTPLES